MTIFKFCACDVFSFSVTIIHADVQFNLATLRFLMLCCDGGVDAYKLVAVDKNGWHFSREMLAIPKLFIHNLVST
jgi:hypothetical protein